MTYSATNGIYVYTKPTAESLRNLQPFLKPFGTQAEPESEIHCTVVYSKTPVTLEDSEAAVKASVKMFEARGYEIVSWEGHDKAGYVVLLLRSYQLDVENRKWKCLGATSTFSDYKPHITLAKDLDITKVSFLINKLNLMIGQSGIPLIFSDLFVSDLNK